MKKQLSTLSLVLIFSTAVTAGGGLGQQNAEEVPTGESHDRWEQEAQESEMEYQQRMEDAGAEKDKPMVDPGYDLYEKDEFDRKQKEGF